MNNLFKVEIFLLGEISLCFPLSQIRALPYASTSTFPHLHHSSRCINLLLIILNGTNRKANTCFQWFGKTVNNLFKVEIFLLGEISLCFPLSQIRALPYASTSTFPHLHHSSRCINLLLIVLNGTNRKAKFFALNRTNRKVRLSLYQYLNFILLHSR